MTPRDEDVEAVARAIEDSLTDMISECAQHGGEFTGPYPSDFEAAARAAIAAMPGESELREWRADVISEENKRKFAACPTCKQYSHSIGEDQLAAAYRHFQTMYSHRGDGIPTQFCFPMETRDAAQILMAAARGLPPPPISGEA